MYFDTLTVAQNLMKADMPAPQAEAIAKEYANLMQHQIDQFSTKEDLKHLENRLETKIEGLFLRLIVTMGGMFATTTGLLFAAMKLFM
jgi:hypothetical protein